MIISIFLLYQFFSIAYTVHAPPPGYYCYLKCINKCLATPPLIKVRDQLDFCKREVCWPMTGEEKYCDPEDRKCFIGTCKASDVGWITDQITEPIKKPVVTSKRDHDVWTTHWDAVPGAQFYAIYHWEEGANASKFHHEEIQRTSFPLATHQCKQHFARVAAISTTGMSVFTPAMKAKAFLNETEELYMKLDIKSTSLVPMPYFYDPVPSVPTSTPPEPVEQSTLILTIGYELKTPGWNDKDVLDLIDYAFLPVSCPQSDSKLDLASLKPMTVNSRREFVLDLPGSIAQRKCKFLFTVKSISAPCGRTIRVTHATAQEDDGKYGLWATLDCAKIENAVCQDVQDISTKKPGQPKEQESDNWLFKEEAKKILIKQIPRVKTVGFLDDGTQTLALLLALLLIVPICLFLILSCCLKDRRQKEQNTV